MIGGRTNRGVGSEGWRKLDERGRLPRRRYEDGASRRSERSEMPTERLSMRKTKERFFDSNCSSSEATPRSRLRWASPSARPARSPRRASPRGLATWNDVAALSDEELDARI